MKRTIFIILGLLLNLGLCASSLDKNPYIKVLKKADAYLSYGEYSNALPYYLKADSINPGVAEVDYKIGMCYVYSIHHEQALPYLKKAYDEGFRNTKKPKMEKNMFFDAYESQSLFFNLGRAYHWNYYFDEAIEFYEKELERYETAYQDSHIKEKGILRKFIRQAENAKVLVKDTVEFIVQNLGPTINTEYEEMAPQVTSDEDILIFTASYPNTTGGKKDAFGDYMEDVYISHKGQDGNWKKPIPIKKVNTGGHDAAIGLSPEGDELLIYRNNKHLTGDIYISTKENKSWSTPQKMPEGINTKYLENSASMVKGGNRIYFTSSRLGGLGGEDIYMCERKLNGEWSLPRNLGANINTPYDDDAPFIAADEKTLYFSSKGHNSMGGFDIFKSTYNDELDIWSTPINMGFPINTPEHDIFFVWSVDGKRAYFSSHRKDSYGLDDIYMMMLPEVDEKLVESVGLIGNVRNSKGKLLKAEVKILDYETGKTLSICNTSTKGDYNFKLNPNKKYKIQVNSKETIPYEEVLYLPEATSYYDARQDVVLQLPKKGLTVTLKNVHFDYNKSTLRTESYPELDKFAEILKNKEKFEVEIAGHTDNIGSDEYNLKLSLERAQVVVDYLISKGVNKKKIFAVGYGETTPVATNQTDKGRQENRRTNLTLHDNREGKIWKRKKRKEAKILLGKAAKNK